MRHVVAIGVWLGLALVANGQMVAECIANCDMLDSQCQANCVSGPDEFEDTLACAEQCPMTNTRAFQECINDCIRENSFPSGTGGSRVATSTTEEPHIQTGDDDDDGDRTETTSAPASTTTDPSGDEGGQEANNASSTASSRTSELVQPEWGDGGSRSSEGSGNGSGGSSVNSTAIGLGVGLGVGIPLIVAVAAFFWFKVWRAKRRDAAAAAASSVAVTDGKDGSEKSKTGIRSELTGEDSNQRTELSDASAKYELAGRTPVTRYELPAGSVRRAPL